MHLNNPIIVSCKHTACLSGQSSIRPASLQDMTLVENTRQTLLSNLLRAHAIPHGVGVEPFGTGKERVLFVTLTNRCISWPRNKS